MTSTTSSQSVRRPRPSSRVPGEPLPTLFRIPEIGRTQVSDGSEPQSQPSSQALDSIAAGEPPEDESPLAAMAPEPDYERIDPSHAYNDLPELPRIDEPAGRSWMETVGSRLVLILLFLAVATVAILATRDVPLDTGSNLLADDRDDQDATLHVAEAAPSHPPHQHHASHSSSERLTPDPLSGLSMPSPIGSHTSQQDSIHNTIDEASRSAETPAISDPTTPVDGGVDSLPSLDDIQDGPSDSNMPGPPLPAMPELALHPAADSQTKHDDDESAIVDEAVSTTDDDLTDAGAVQQNPLVSQSESETDTAAQTDGASQTAADELVHSPSITEAADSDPMQQDALQVASLPNSPAAENPVYLMTETPAAIKDWSRYVQNNSTVGYQQASRGPTTPGGQPPVPINQFNYPTPPVQPSALNQQSYAPYAMTVEQSPAHAIGGPIPQGAYYPGQPTYPPQDPDATQQQQQPMPTYTPGQAYAGPAGDPQLYQQQLQMQQQQAWQQEQAFLQQQAMQQQQQQPAGYVPGTSGQPAQYRQPAAGYYPPNNQVYQGDPANYGNTNQAPYGGQPPYVPNR